MLAESEPIAVTIVFVIALLLNFGIRALDQQVKNDSSGLHNATRIIGTLVSGTFLYLIALLTWSCWSRSSRYSGSAHGRYSDAELEAQLDNRGLMNRVSGGYARRIDTPWKMYPVGGLRAAVLRDLVAAHLVRAGMCLFDTADGCFMNFAYDWAFARPVREVYYNLTITGLSVFVAFFIGTIEILSLLGDELNLTARSGTSWPTST